MAKKKRSKGSKSNQTRVHPIDARANALRSFLGLTPAPNLIDTRRVPYSPAPIPSRTVEAPTRLFMGRKIVSDPVTPSTSPYLKTTPVVRPEKTICSRRQSRKEVIHAFNHAGKAGQKKPVRTETSNIHCK